MNKRNLALVAAALAVVVAVAFTVFPRLNHSAVMHVFQFPAVLLAVAISADSHAPSVLAAWTAFIAYMGVWSLAFLVFYALLLEIYLERKAARHFHQAHVAWEQREHAPSAVLEQLGHARMDLEKGRRASWFLMHDETIKPDNDPRQVAAEWIARERTDGAARRMIHHLSAHLTAKLGEPRSQQAIASIRAAAHAHRQGGTSAL